MKMFMVVILMVLVVGYAGVSRACEGCGYKLSKSDSSEPAALDSKASAALAAVNVGNKVCPFMNSPVTQETAVKVEHKGKEYNLCCNMCKAAFLKDPESAIKKFQ